MIIMFHLSSNTVISVKGSKFSPENYLQVKRLGDRDRWINVGAPAWRKLTEAVQEIDEAIHKVQDLAIDLYKIPKGSQKVVVSFIMGVAWQEPYVGIHMFDEKGERERGKGLNLVCTEWNRLKEAMDEINSRMTKPSFPRDWEYRETSKSIYRSFVKTFKGETKHMGQWSFDYPEIEKPKPGCYFMVQEQVKTMPKAAVLLVQCFSYLVHKRIQAVKQCLGCDLDRPSQFDHLDGCMVSSSQAMEIYGDQARESVDIKDVMGLYNNVREKMDVAPAVGTFDVQAYLKSCKVEDNVDDWLKDLFNELC